MMKRIIAFICILAAVVALAVGCGKNAEPIVSEDKQSTQSNKTEDNTEIMTPTTTVTESESLKEPEKTIVKADQIYITVGESTLTVALEDNESAHALKELLADGPLTISASNYGGFEKVCSLGTNLPRNDSQTTTQAGDICLYNGNQIVIFYGSNSWAYTRLGKVTDKSAQELETILSGEETEITLSLTI